METRAERLALDMQFAWKVIAERDYRIAELEDELAKANEAIQRMAPVVGAAVAWWKVGRYKDSLTIYQTERALQWVVEQYEKHEKPKGTPEREVMDWAADKLRKLQRLEPHEWDRSVLTAVIESLTNNPRLEVNDAD